MKNNRIDEKAMQVFQRRALKNALSHDHVYHEIVSHLLMRLDYIRIAPSVIVNFAWHTGQMHSALQEKYPLAEIIDVTCVDALKQLKENSVDCVIAHFAFFNAADPKLVIQLCHYILREEGLLLFVECGPDTLQELRSSFLAADKNPHVHAFFDMHDVGDWMRSFSFADPVMDREMITLAYDRLDVFFKELKAVGMMNAHPVRARGLLSKRQWQKMIAHYETLKEDNYFPVSLELMYGHGWKVTTVPSDEVYISIDAIGRR
ncbi:MAG: methyltransferase domain-containing protein [Coxiellaceae bacterium]|nr:methyltransferase domain-containing protein [Coxiellaceae bacterium]